jgi:hypothetical protein
LNHRRRVGQCVRQRQIFRNRPPLIMDQASAQAQTCQQHRRRAGVGEPRPQNCGAPELAHPFAGGLVRGTRGPPIPLRGAFWAGDMNRAWGPCDAEFLSALWTMHEERSRGHKRQRQPHKATTTRGSQAVVARPWPPLPRVAPKVTSIAAKLTSAKVTSCHERWGKLDWNPVGCQFSSVGRAMLS